MTISKTCTKCGETQPTSNFHKSKANKDGLVPVCKGCRIAYMKAYYADNRESEIDAKAEQWSTMTQAEKSAKGSVVTARKRSDLSSADLYGGLTYTEACTMTLPFAEERLRLEAITGIPHHIDHIISLKEGGTHTADNLQVLTASDNFAKG